MNLKFVSLTRNRLVLMLLFTFIITTGHSQEKSKKELKKELKEKQKLEKEKEIESLINSKTFVFVARTALPNNRRSIDLTTNPNFLKFDPKIIDSDMPFFGRAFSATYGGTDGGLKFNGEPSKFDIEKGKKKYNITVEVKDKNEYYRIFLAVGLEGSASLNILSNNKGPMNYNGTISKPEVKETKEK